MYVGDGSGKMDGRVEALHTPVKDPRPPEREEKIPE